MKTMLFNPYSGKPRDPRDIASDPSGILMLDPDEPMFTAKPPEQGRADVAVDWDAVGRIIEAHYLMRMTHSAGTTNWAAGIWRAAQPPASPVAVPEILSRLHAVQAKYRSSLAPNKVDEEFAQIIADIAATQTPLQPLADSRGSDEVGV